VNALGHSERSSVREGLVDGNTLGALLVEDVVSGVAFGIGTGFTAAQRQEIWDRRDQWQGKIVKYKRQPTGVKDAPRFPVFLGLREAFDMG
jgi:DNA ligase-1